MIAAAPDAAIAQILALVTDRTGLRVAANRVRDAEAGVRRAAGRAGCGDTGRYLKLLEAGHPLDDLLTELTVRETHFFRHPGHFELVRRVIQDNAARRGPAHMPRLWSAGCASGEEAYSLAMLMAEEGAPAFILATDVSLAALRSAQAATYGRWSMRGLDAARLARWFQAAGERWRLDDAIRKRVRFEHHNLLRHAYPPPAAGAWGMDVIFCRNVLLYFDGSDLEHVARGFSSALADGGWLITGPSDPSLDGLGSLRATVTEAGVIYQRASAQAPCRVSTPPASASPPPSPALSIEARAVRSETPKRPEPAALHEALALAQRAFEAGDYEAARDLLRDARDEASSLLYVRATANAGLPEVALSEVRRRSSALPLSASLHFLEAMLLVGAGRFEDAAQALRRALYLEPSSAIAYYVLGAVLRRQHRLRDARNAYRNARDLARALRHDTVLPMGEGEQAGNLVRMAEAELALLDREVSA